MANDLRGNWKEAGVGLGHAFRDLGKTLIKTGATAMQKADEWANSNEAPNNGAAENATTVEAEAEPENVTTVEAEAVEEG